VDEITIVETVSATGKKFNLKLKLKYHQKFPGEMNFVACKEKGQVVKKRRFVRFVKSLIYILLVGSFGFLIILVQRNWIESNDTSFKEAQSNYNRNKTLFDKELFLKSTVGTKPLHHSSLQKLK
jgi:HlyD family secretion protein